MGVHQLKLSLVPKAYFERIGAPIPEKLTNEDVDRGESEGTGWWASLQPTAQALARLRQLCPIDKSWGETEEFVTRELWGSDLRIWKEQGRIWLVTLRFSPGTDHRKLLEQFVAIASDENCLILDGQSGFLMEPTVEIVIQHMLNSRAMRFVQDPQSAVIEAAKKTPQ